ncbi:flagellar hook-length control protein FliK [Salipiger abyssi]|uniref:flagellar hook-length control protein FliK n=1 Tax=Salipiger abyssi TaxID=1250539 RepID=UPI004059CF8D
MIKLFSLLTAATPEAGKAPAHAGDAPQSRIFASLLSLLRSGDEAPETTRNTAGDAGDAMDARLAEAETALTDPDLTDDELADIVAPLISDLAQILAMAPERLNQMRAGVERIATEPQTQTGPAPWRALAEALPALRRQLFDSQPGMPPAAEEADASSEALPDLVARIMREASELARPTQASVPPVQGDAPVPVSGAVQGLVSAASARSDLPTMPPNPVLEDIAAARSVATPASNMPRSIAPAGTAPANLSVLAAADPTANAEVPLEPVAMAHDASLAAAVRDVAGKAARTDPAEAPAAPVARREIDRTNALPGMQVISDKAPDMVAASREEPLKAYKLTASSPTALQASLAAPAASVVAAPLRTTTGPGGEAALLPPITSAPVTTPPIVPATPEAPMPPRAAPPLPSSEQIFGQVRAQLGQDGQIRVALKPEGLGQVEIELTPDDNGQLRVAVRADQPSVLSLLRTERDGLLTLLRDGGHQVDARGLSFSDLGARNPGQGQSQGQSATPFSGQHFDGTGPEDAVEPAPDPRHQTHPQAGGVDIQV